jgi:hypothetical protein
MNVNRTIQLVEIPIGGKGGSVWNRLHAERESICELLLKNSYVVSDGRKQLLQSRLRKIDDALDRLMSGSYGNCSECGRSITDTGLDIDPVQSLCLDCWSQAPTARNSTESKEKVGDVDSTQGLAVQSLNAFDTIKLQTQNSDYRILLLDPATGRALVDGGAHLLEPSEALLRGSATPGSEFRGSEICIGSRFEMWVNEKVFITSPVKAVEVQRHDAAESLSEISAALQ